MIRALGASDLRDGLAAALEALRDREAALDALNVYPVPDADTGTNMVLTFEAVVDAARRAGAADPEIARGIRSGALMGARGNSGVIAAQILHAWADAVEAGPADVEGVARAFKRAVELAYEAVLEPAEGTILTVLRAASDAASGEHEHVAAQIVSAARASAEALVATRTQLAVLERNGVVDAGGAGLAVVLATFARLFAGEEVALPSLASDAAWRCELDASAFAYEVMYNLRAPEHAIPAFRELLGTIGDSVAVIGSREAWRVHVHTDDRDRAVALGAAIGATSDIEIVSFADQIAEGRTRGARGVGLSRAADTATLVAVADGEGLQRLFRELGARVAPDGGALATLIADAPPGHVIVLPNAEEIRRAALAIAAESPHPVIVLPAPDPAAGLAAAVAFDDTRHATDVAAEMRDVLARVRSAGVDSAPLDAARALLAGGGEVLTVVCGAATTPGARERLSSELAAALPSVAVEVHDGGQSSPAYLLAVE